MLIEKHAKGSSERDRPMRIHTCEFVFASELFKGLAGLWDEFVNSEPSFS